MHKRLTVTSGRLGVCVVIALAGLPGIVRAESGAPQPPRFETLDSVGVDLLSQSLSTRGLPSISTAGISWQPTGFGRQDNLTGQYENSIVSFLGSSIDLTKKNGQYASVTCTSTAVDVGTCTLVLRDGTEVIYDKTKRSNVGIIANTGVVTKITKPDREILTYSYRSYGPYPTAQTQIYWQILASVQSSLGWQVRYTGGQNTQMSFQKVYIVNSSIDYCDPASEVECVAADSATWPYVTTTDLGGGYKFTDALGQTNTINLHVMFTGPTNYIYNASGTRTLGTTRTAALDPNDGYKVSTLTIGSSVWTYVNPHPAGGVDDRTTVTDPAGNTKVLIHESTFLGSRRPLSYQDELGRVTKWVYQDDTQGPTRVVTPEATYSGSTLTGGYTDYVYDARNNIVSVSVVPKGGGTALVTLASYPTTCTNAKTCNKPDWVKDPKGNQTDFTYDATHGGVLTETAPADANGVRPQKRYSYSLLYPKVKNSSGVLVNSTPVWRLTRLSICQTAVPGNPASCVGTAQELVTTYAYNNNNLLQTSVTVAAGDNSVSATTSYTYDSNGRQTSVDGPRTDVDDTSYTTYDALGRPVFEIGIDPDGTGALQRVVMKHNYDADGREYLTQTGTGNATNGSDFVVSSFKRNTYDSATGLLLKTEVGQP